MEHVFSLTSLAVNPFDLVLMCLSLFLGVFLRKRFSGITIFLQVSILLVKMAKHYYDTHPDAAQHFKLVQHYKKLDNIYEEKLGHHDKHRILKASHETQAAG